MEKLYIGAAYYPELWEESEVERDIARCKELGINCLRVGEFAWGRMEPEEGKFDLGWLKSIVDKLYENGINTVMCTPSATPPRWLLNKYPETRRVMHDLIRSDVSSRCHICKTSPVMREKNRMIVTELAKTFEGHKGVIGWQIDNEIFPYSDGCYCENCKNAFRTYLKERFGTAEKLNKAWGMARWSLGYGTFNDVEPPYPNQWRHPSLRKAWHDFHCRQIKTYVEEQAEVLHRHGAGNIGTDMMPQNLLSYYQMTEHLDVVQYNHYEFAKDLSDTAFAYDFLRCVKDQPFWVTETQAGWNGSDFAECGYRPVGNCYVNTWLPIAKGAQMNLYWLFRAHPNGHELAHGALYSSAGRQYRVSEEVKQVVRDLKKCGSVLSGSKIKSKIALHYSSTAAVGFMCAPLLKNFHYRGEMVYRFYEAFHHYNIDVIDTLHNLEEYEIVISSFLTHADENGFKERITEWVLSGGTWIVGPMTDIMDNNVSKYTHAPYSFLEELAGVYTKYQKPVANDVFKAKWSDGSVCSIRDCYDAYECRENTKSLAVYDGDEFNGLSVITERRAGKGKVVLLGSVVSHDDLLRLVNLPPIAKASENVILTERDNGVIIAAECDHKDGFLELNGEYTDLLTDRKLKGKTALTPYEVLILQK